MSYLKAILNTLCFCLIIGSLTAQEHLANDETYTKQIGVDATAFLSNFFNFSSSGTFDDPLYFLSYKKHRENNTLRLGFGGDIEIDGEGNGTDTDFLLNFRLGTEKHIDFAKRWRAYYGWDAKMNFLFRSLGNSDNSQTQIGIGASPVFGMEFFVNSRMSLMVEGAYNMFLVVKDRGGETSLGGLTGFSAPNFLVVNFAF